MGYRVDEITGKIQGQINLNTDVKEGSKLRSDSLPDDINSRLSALELKLSLNDNITAPRQLLSFGFSESIENWLFSLYPEALIYNGDIDITIDNALYKSINKYAVMSSNTSTRYIYPTIRSTGYSDKQITIPIIDVNPTNGQSKNIRFMAIGSSNVQNGYAVHVQKLVNRLNADLGNVNVTMIGTRTSESSVIDTYKGNTYNFPSGQCFCEGWAGHSMVNIMRNFIQARSVAGTSESYIMYGDVLWDSLGLGTKTRNGAVGRSYTTYTYTKSQQTEIGSTCHGYYDADPTQTLWNWICLKRGMAGHSFTVDGVIYTFGNSYSSSDNNAQKAYIKYLCYNPLISFFDYNTVQSSNGSYAFNFSAYINKYRTMTDDGQRLYFNASGSTTGSAGTNNTGYLANGSATQYKIGSLVNNTLQYNVCLPNFINLTLGANDANNYDPTLFTSEEVATKVITDIKTMVTLIKNYVSAINIGIGFYHYYGVLNPDKWVDVGIMRKFPATSWYQNLHHLINKKCMEEVFDKSSSAAYCPIYYTQNVIGAPTQLARNINTQNTIIYDASPDQLHAVGDGWNGTAIGIIAWIWSLLQ